VAEQEQADAVGEQGGGLGQRVARRQAKLAQGGVDGIQRSAQAGVEGGVEGRGQAARLQPLEQVETQFQIVRAALVEIEKRARSGGGGIGDLRGVDVGAEALQGFVQQCGVQLFLAGKIAVDRARRIPGAVGDFADAGLVHAQFQKRGTRGIQHALAAQVRQFAVAALARCVGDGPGGRIHRLSIGLDNKLNVVQYKI